MQPEMLFRLGSTTKMFTAAALVTLADTGVIVLTNKSGETMRRSLNKATEMVLGLKDDEPEKPASFAPLTNSEMNEYAGTYSHAPQTWEV